MACLMPGTVNFLCKVSWNAEGVTQNVIMILLLSMILKEKIDCKLLRAGSVFRYFQCKAPCRPKVQYSSSSSNLKLPFLQTVSSSCPMLLLVALEPPIFEGCLFGEAAVLGSNVVEQKELKPHTAEIWISINTRHYG